MVEKAGIPFETCAYPHDPRTESYGVEAATLLGVPPDWVFKTLIVKLDGRELIVTMLPIHQSLDLKAVAAAGGAKRAEMTDVTEAERITGYVAGGISPLGATQETTYAY
jgi:Cys-tRNA(Pro)/Cys-tRNA(Cys) deacylase